MACVNGSTSVNVAGSALGSAATVPQTSSQLSRLAPCVAAARMRYPFRVRNKQYDAGAGVLAELINASFSGLNNA